MTALFLQIISLIANIGTFVFLGYYLLKVRQREKILAEKENKVDVDYHRIVDDALSKERKILEDASKEANQLVASVKYVNDDTKEAVNQVLKNIIAELQKESVSTAGAFMQSYSASLKQLVDNAVSEFSKTTRGFQENLEKQTKEFQNSMLPGLEKELEEYKKTRLKQADEVVIRVVQKVSHELLNKSISLTDHQDLLVQSLEKAKKEGLFD